MTAPATRRGFLTVLGFGGASVAIGAAAAQAAPPPTWQTKPPGAWTLNDHLAEANHHLDHLKTVKPVSGDTDLRKQMHAFMTEWWENRKTEILEGRS